MAKLQTVRRFRDKTVGVVREIGETFEVSEQRAKVIIASGYAKIIKEPKTDTEQKKKKSKRKGDINAHPTGSEELA